MTRHSVHSFKLVLLVLFSIYSSASTALDLLPDFNLFGGDDEKGTMVWQGGDQYVKLVPIEDSAKGQNQHPARITLEELQTVLKELRLEESSGIFNDEVKRIPLFVNSEVNILSSALSRALERAKPDEDITFVIFGRHEGLITAENMAMAGRVFFRDERLNIILGDTFRTVAGTTAQRHANQAAGCGDCPVDTRETPYKVGRRDKEHKLDMPFAHLDGLLLERKSGGRRSDWLTIDIDKVLAVVEREKNKLPPALQKDRQRARQESAQIAIERRQMREEMARMRKEMKDMQQGGGKTGNSVEQRMATLNALHKKGLISKAEYEAKRQEILNDI